MLEDRKKSLKRQSEGISSSITDDTLVVVYIQHKFHEFYGEPLS